MKVLVLGAGQLARMMAQDASRIGVEVIAFDVRTDCVVEPITLADQNLSLSQAIDLVDVITSEFEHIPLPILELCKQSDKLLPSAEAIRVGADRRNEKHMLDNAEVPNADYRVVVNRDDIDRAIDILDLPLVFKSALDGYDGKGQWRLKHSKDTDSVALEIHDFLKNSSATQGIVAEQFVKFDREVSIIGAKTADGSSVYYPVTENHHYQGVLHLSLAYEANTHLQKQAEHIFDNIAELLDYVGVLAVECFDVHGKLLVNEIAPRVHNSGHWTQQGAATSQFENHLRAVCNMPLGKTDLLQPTAMINLLGIDELPEALSEMEDVYIHWYGKEKRPGRKMGHINVTAASSDALKQKLVDIAAILPKDTFPVLDLYR